MDWNLSVIIQKPVYQAMFFLLITPVVVFLMQPKTADSAWVIAAYLFALFLIINSGLLWFEESRWRYFFYSIASSVGYLVIIGITMPVLLRLFHIKGSGESAMAFLILIYQPFALMLVMVAKWIVLKF